MSLSSSCGVRGINLDNGMYEEFKTILGDICNGLFPSGEDSFGTRGMSSIWKLPRRHYASEKELHQLKHRSCA